MATIWVAEASAVRIAADLSRQHGALALDRAEQRRSSAADTGNIKRADLYRAVCTIIANRGEVFSRSRPPLNRRS